MPEDNVKPKSAAQNTNLVKQLYFGTAEKTFMESGYHPDSFFNPYNRDDLYQRDMAYEIYEDMLTDDQVDAAMQLKRDLVIGSGWNIVTEKDGDEEMADDIFKRLEEDPTICLDDQLDDLISNAYSYGFAIGEKIFKRKADNSLTWHELKVRHPSTWLLWQDKKGNIERYEQQGVGNGRGIDVNPKSIIHYINRPLHQNPYGQSDLRSAYNAWFTKRHIVRYYSMFLEGSAKPIPHAKYDKNVPQSRVDEMLDILKKFQARTAIVVPKEFEVGFLEATSNGEAFTKGIDLFNMFIGRALFIPDLLGFTGPGSQKGGSQALGREQVDMFLKHIEKRRRLVERYVNWHIIRPLVAWNFGEVEFYPKFQLRPITEDNAMDFAQRWIDAVRGKIYKPTPEEVNHFRDLIKFPENENVEFPGEAGDAGGGGLPGNPFGGNLPDGQQPVADPTVTGTVPAKDPKLADEVAGKVDDEDKMGKGKKPKKEFQFAPTPGGFADKTNFEPIEKALDAEFSQLMTEVTPIVNDIFEDLIDRVEKKNILGQRPKVSKVQQIKTKSLKPLQQMLKKHFRKAFQEHAAIARNELFKQNFAVPLESDTFAELLEQETFEYVGDWEFNVTEGARRAMRQAIKEGQPISTVINLLDTDGKRDSLVSLERFARTKTTEIMNRARVEEFRRSKVVAGFQYSAIMDGRTTEVCRGLHGKKFQIGTEPIPPLHFNCRSVLIPITIFEQFEPDGKVGKTNIDTFIAEKSGKGFGPISR